MKIMRRRFLPQVSLKLEKNPAEDNVKLLLLFFRYRFRIRRSWVDVQLMQSYWTTEIREAFSMTRFPCGKE